MAYTLEPTDIIILFIWLRPAASSANEARLQIRTSTVECDRIRAVMSSNRSGDGARISANLLPPCRKVSGRATLAPTARPKDSEIHRQIGWVFSLEDASDVRAISW